MASSPEHDHLKMENDELRARLEEAEAIVRAISKHEVDAFVVQEPEGGDGILVLDGVDRPYRLVIERMQQGTAIVGAGGTIVYANGRLAEMAEAPIESLLGTPFTRCVREADRAAVQQLLSTPGKDAEIEVLLNGAGGK